MSKLSFNSSGADFTVNQNHDYEHVDSISSVPALPIELMGLRYGWDILSDVP